LAESLCIDLQVVRVGLDQFVQPALVLLLEAGGADEDILKLVIFWVGGLLGDGRLLLHLVAEL
jgi:hypothetical protein